MNPLNEARRALREISRAKGSLIIVMQSGLLTDEELTALMAANAALATAIETLEGGTVKGEPIRQN